VHDDPRRLVDDEQIAAVIQDALVTESGK
jgi:hypothetical protein